MSLKEERTRVRAGHNARIARLVNTPEFLGTRPERDDYLAFMKGLFAHLAAEGLLVRISLEDELVGWRLAPGAVRLKAGPGINTAESALNPYFRELYLSIAEERNTAKSAWWGLEAREHTGQATTRLREFSREALSLC